MDPILNADLNSIFSSSKQMAQDALTSCTTCQAFVFLENTVQQLYMSTFDIVAIGLAGFLVSLMGVYLIIKIGQQIAGAGNAPNYGDLVLKLIFFSFVYTSLVAGGGWFWPLFNFLSSIGPWVGKQMIVAYGEDISQFEGFAALIYAADQSILGKVYDTLINQADDIGWTATIAHTIGVFLLFLVYLTLSWRLVKGFLIGYFESAAVAFLAPFLMAFVIFEQTRPLTYGGLRLLMSGAAKMILGSVTIVLVLYLMDQMHALFYDTKEFQGINDIWGSDYLFMLEAGFIMTLITVVFEDVANRLFMTFGRNFASNFGSMGALIRWFGAAR